MKRVKSTTRKKRSLLYVRTMTLAMADRDILQQLRQEATDYLGRSVSNSAIVRALVRYADQQDETWAREQLFSLVEQEFNAGVMWGKK